MVAPTNMQTYYVRRKTYEEYEKKMDFAVLIVTDGFSFAFQWDSFNCFCIK